jgi:hypothetical protein
MLVITGDRVVVCFVHSDELILQSRGLYLNEGGKMVTMLGLCVFLMHKRWSVYSHCQGISWVCSTFLKKISEWYTGEIGRISNLLTIAV